MAERKKLLTSLVITMALIALNLAALNALLASWPSLRLDLTEEGIYSISPATRRILTGLDEDLTITGYFSTRTHPKLAPLIPRIKDLLDEYEALSRGRVKVQIVDPGEDEEVEEEAKDRYGVESVPFRLASKYEAGIVNAYFALVVKYGDQYVRYGFDDLIEIEPLPDGDVEVRLRNLEYDLTRAIKKSVYGFRGAAELFERVETPLKLTMVVSADSVPEVFKDVPDAVRKAAEELGEKGAEKFVFEEIDPSGDEAVQREVLSRFGARPMTLGLFGDQQFYLYGFLESGGRLEQLNLAGEGISAAAIREAIEDVLRRQTPGFLKTVGVVTPEPMIPPELMMQLRMQGRMPPQPPPEFQQVKRFLELDYQVRDVKLDSEVPTEVDVLLVLKPKNLGDREVFNLDQYLMRGGRVIVAGGPYEADFAMSGLRVSPVTTGLDEWLAHLGVEIPQTLVLDDQNQPLPIPEIRQTAIGQIRTWRMAPYPYLVEVRDDGFVNREIAAGLGGMGVYWGSPVQADGEKHEAVEVFEILQSSDSSWTDNDISRVGYVDYEVPAEGTEPHVLAVALSGRLPSFFAGKEPPRDEPAMAEDEGEDDVPPPRAEVVLEESPETRLAVIGNAEFLSDFVARAIGSQDGGFFAENLTFMQNLIDWINLDNDMLGIRSRGVAARRIERVERGTEVMIEVVSYAVPVIILLALAGFSMARRRNVAPILQPTSESRAPRRVEG
jgi:ABC-2 type transport system permease protein